VTVRKGVSNLDKPSRPEPDYPEVVIHRLGQEPLVFKGKKIGDQTVSRDDFILKMGLYLQLSREVVLEVKYMDGERHIHFIREFPNPRAATERIYLLHQALKEDREQFLALLEDK